MIKTNIDTLISLLQDAQKKGCTQVKLQLYESWAQVEKEQRQPSRPAEEYQIDTRFYNTLEFETEIENMQATDKIITAVENGTLIIRAAISDRESLLRNLGIEE